jgi:transcriptional regulator with XRE-family HTH domain
MNMRISKNLSYLRTSNGRSKAWVSEQLSKSDSNIANYENGKTNPPLPVIEQYANLFNVYIGDLVGRDLWLGEGGQAPQEGQPDSRLLREKDALHGLLDTKEDQIRRLKADVIALARRLKSDPAAKEHYLAISEVLAHLEKG